MHRPLTYLFTFKIVLSQDASEEFLTFNIININLTIRYTNDKIATGTDTK